MPMISSSCRKYSLTFITTQPLNLLNKAFNTQQTPLVVKIKQNKSLLHLSSICKGAKVRVISAQLRLQHGL